MRTFGLACLLSLVLLLSGCGSVFFRADWNGGSQTASGLVSIVQLTFVVDNNNISTQVTIVTLANNLGASNFTFCGDQRTQFPLDRFAKATFTPGRTCSTLLSVVIKI
jgi:uncharacterized protein YceK